MFRTPFRFAVLLAVFLVDNGWMPGPKAPDPKEETDLSGDPEHAPTKGKLLRMLDGWWSIDRE